MSVRSGRSERDEAGSGAAVESPRVPFERVPQALQTAERTNVLYFAGRPIGLWKKVGTAAATLTALTTDHLGTPVFALDSAGNALWYGGFEPFGRDWQEGSANDSLTKGIFLRMPGQWDDTTWADPTLGLDLFYNVHRWYEMPTGRYASADPFKRSGQSNQFVYSAARPLSLADPFGLFEIDPSCDCPPTPLDTDSVPRAIGQARKYFYSPGCQKLLDSYPDAKGCLGPRFGDEELGKGPRILCKPNPNRAVPPCGEFEPSASSGDPSTIILYPGHPGCPRFTGEGLGQTLFHEAVHSCGLLPHDETFKAIVMGCTGGL